MLPALKVVNPSPLAHLHAGRMRLRGEHAKFIAVRNRLNEAGNREREALAAIGSLGAEEVGAMREWASAGAVGDPPRADEKRRATLAKDLASAQIHAAAAKGAIADIETQEREVSDQLRAIDRQIEQAAADELADAARAEAAKLRPLAEQIAAGLAKVIAVRMALSQLGRDRSDQGDLDAARPFFRLAEAMSTEPAIESMPTNGQVSAAISATLANFAALVSGRAQ